MLGSASENFRVSCFYIYIINIPTLSRDFRAGVSPLRAPRITESNVHSNLFWQIWHLSGGDLTFLFVLIEVLSVSCLI